jgi:hypothetical protein
MFRYWDGSAWSAALASHPSAPPPPGLGVVPGGQSAPWPASQPGLGPVSLPTERGAADVRGRPRSRTGWLVAAIAVVVAITIAVVLIVRASGGGGMVDPGPVPPTTSAQVCPDAIQPSAAPPAQAGGRVTSGKLSYPRLGAPWSAPAWDRRVPFGRDVSSQQATVEADAVGKPTWVADVMVARLLAGDGFYGPEQGAAVVVNCITGRFYGDSTVKRTDRRNSSTSVDGHPAWLVESHLTFDVPDIKTRGELMIVLVVDTAEGEGGLFYASVPDTSALFVAPAREALAGLAVA